MRKFANKNTKFSKVLPRYVAFLQMYSLWMISLTAFREEEYEEEDGQEEEVEEQKENSAQGMTEPVNSLCKDMIHEERVRTQFKTTAKSNKYLPLQG